MQDSHSQPYLEIIVHTSRIAHNYHSLQKLCASSSVAAVLKADAYGLGMVPIAHILKKEGCSHFFVAYLNEALELRQHFPDVTITVLNGPFNHELPIYHKHKITPALNTLKQVREFSSYVKSLKESQSFHAALQLETGFSRLGLGEQDIKELLENKELSFPISLIMSHLSCAGDVNHPHNQIQIETFERICAYFPQNIPKSLLASSGITQSPHHHYDLIRAGILLYGYHVPQHLSKDFKPALTIRSRILQIKDVPQGGVVGYDATYQAKKPLKIALISVGYADGYARLLGKNGRCFSQGETFPIIGAISMDSLAIDITESSHLKEGDFVEIVNEHFTVDHLTKDTPQSSYEFLTSLSKRCQRVYTNTIP